MKINAEINITNDVISRDSRVIYFKVKTDNDLVEIDNQSVVFPLSAKIEDIEQEIKKNVISQINERKTILGTSMAGKKFKVDG